CHFPAKHSIQAEEVKNSDVFVALSGLGVLCPVSRGVAPGFIDFAPLGLDRFIAPLGLGDRGITRYCRRRIAQMGRAVD
ncbi:MAG: hypothetical protein ACOCWJ_05815, partial [Verrucomicrobiota bacterium]